MNSQWSRNMQINTQPGIQPYKVTRKKHNSSSSQVPEFELQVGDRGKREPGTGKERPQPKADPDHRIDVEA
jgi:hypothetical protein